MGFTLPAFDTALIPPLLFFAVPIFLASSRLYYFFKPDPKPDAYNPETGLGRGAPGFLTGSRKVALPLHIAARIKMGEEVTPEEITEALEEQRLKEEEEERKRLLAEERERSGAKTMKIPDSVDEDWLPAGATSVGGGRGGAARRRKK
ncbi:hypothetical protein BCR35DRAFT_275436 [Leucosporidium creatinivorum]|uniref:Uncharacterized protein n=1 Tax=Leucosporidium creatinivorum TaxID=106004 RepID=A0A1Y2FZT6_9BASI|nr:hypothetical protein BCR35DRAFT_275436 [Leucosporidium creatinivorum]